MNLLHSTVATFLQGVRIAGSKKAPLFCMNDVADRLGVTQAGGMASAWRLPAGDKAHRIIQTSGGPQLALFVTSSGFLRLALAGRMPEAKAFRDKIADVTLPKKLRPAETELVKRRPPKAVLALAGERRDHILFWLSVMAEIAGSPRRNETISALARKHRRRGGVSKSTCARYFKLWSDAGGDWRVLDRWASIATGRAPARHGCRTPRKK